MKVFEFTFKKDVSIRIYFFTKILLLRLHFKIGYFKVYYNNFARVIIYFHLNTFLILKICSSYFSF